MDLEVEARRLVSNLVREAPKLFGGGAPEVIAHERRATSQVLRLRFGGEVPPREVFLKVIRTSSRPCQRERLAERIRADFAQQRRAYQAMAGGPFGVARPVACDPDALLALTEAARGETLDASLRSGTAGVAVLQRVGTWIRHFHAALPTAGTMQLAGIRSYVDLRLRQAMEQGGAFGPEHRRRVLARFDEVASQVEPSQLGAVPIHGDLSLENVIVDGDEVKAIDFDVGAGTCGTRYHDLAYLYVCLERLKAKRWMRGVVDLQRALLVGFDPALQPSRPLFRLMLVQHVACRLAEGAGVRERLREAYDRFGWKPCLHWAGL